MNYRYFISAFNKDCLVRVNKDGEFWYCYPSALAWHKEPNYLWAIGNLNYLWVENTLYTPISEEEVFLLFL